MGLPLEFGLMLQAATTTSQGVNATNPALTSLIASMAGNPYVAVSIIIQFLLGFALGYVSVKALKYVLSFIGILIVGALLNVWSLGTSNVEEALQQYYQEFKQVAPLFKKTIATLGLLTVGPVSIGYIVGLVVGFNRK